MLGRTRLPDLVGDLIGFQICHLTDDLFDRLDVLLHLIGQVRFVDHYQRSFGGIEQVGDRLQVAARNAGLNMSDKGTDCRAAGCPRGECRPNAYWWENRRGETSRETESEPFEGFVPSAGLVGPVNLDLASLVLADDRSVEVVRGAQQRTIADLRGFAGMDADKRRDIAKKGGASVPRDKRSFVRDPVLAAQAGRKGGRAVAPEARSFSSNRELAAQAGRKGGQASQSERRRRLKEV
jgi:uncharacterized protein